MCYGFHSRTLWIVKLHTDSTNGVSSPARKGNHHEETFDHRPRHLCPVPVSVWLACGNERTCKQLGCSLPGKHTERLPGPARSASPPQPGIPHSKRSACRGSGSGKPARRMGSSEDPHEAASVHRPGASATESMLARMWAVHQSGPPSPSTSPSGSRQALALVPMGSTFFVRRGLHSGFRARSTKSRVV